MMRTADGVVLKDVTGTLVTRERRTAAKPGAAARVRVLERMRTSAPLWREDDARS